MISVVYICVICRACSVMTAEESINSRKKEHGQYPAILTEQAWSIKDLLYGFQGNFFLQPTAGIVPSKQDGLLTKREVKMAKLFFCVLMDRDEVEVHKLTKNERAQYPAILTEQFTKQLSSISKEY